jgi:diguanylate cyclase (GGDEF)-like protein
MAHEISHQASHDPLTDLINRREFEHRLQRVLETARTEQVEHALCYVDLDQFKIVNDTCGHAAGDELLRQVARLARQQIRERDTLARLGGDEFGVLMERCSLPQARRAVSALRQAIADFCFEWENTSFRVGVSIGLASITEASESVGAVLRAADSACYAAKKTGRNRIHAYQEGDVEAASQRGQMRSVGRIHRALDGGHFHLAFQPLARIDGNRRGGAHYELLLRMDDEDGRILLPGTFLPAAERYHLSTMLDRWVTSTAFEWLAGHPGHLQRLSLCAINLSALSLGDEEFLAFVVRALAEMHIPPQKICFEITETAAIANLSSATRFIKELKALGCRFALDDFGSGLSSFAYLKALPVDFLKIDGLFVKDIVDNPINLAMVKSINEIGHAMGKLTIAECVENDTVLERVREIGVDYAQGYGIGRPRPIAEMT